MYLYGGNFHQVDPDDTRNIGEEPGVSEDILAGITVWKRIEFFAIGVGILFFIGAIGVLLGL